MTGGILLDIYWPWHFLGLAVVLLILGFLSLAPAWRGHWFALVLVAPTIGCAAFGASLAAIGFFGELRRDQTGQLLVMFLVPLVVACVSIALWAVRNRRERGRAQREEWRRVGRGVELAARLEAESQKQRI